MKVFLALYLVSAICFINVMNSHGVQILSPWVVQLLKQKYGNGIGPGKYIVIQ